METNVTQPEQALAFLAVAEAAGFTAAADRLGVSKAHLSKQVAALESALGVRLLQRTTRRVSLTDAGRLYLDYARRLRESLLDGERAVSAVRTEVDGILRLTAPTSFGDSFLVDLLADFRALHPAVTFDIDLSIGRRDLVADGFDFAFRAARTLEPSLVARPIGVMREVIVASPGFLQRHAPDGVADPDRLASLEAIRNSHFRDESDWTVQREGTSRRIAVRGTLAVNHFVAMRRAALRGLGIARLPRYLVAGDLGDGRLCQLLPDWQLPDTPVSLVYPSREHLPMRSRAFRDFVMAWFEDPDRADLLR